MATPTPTDAHVDSILTNILVAFMQDQNEFVASRVFPIVSVDKQSDLFYSYPRAPWFREEAQLRAPNTESAGGEWTLTTDSYRCDVFAIHKDIDDQLRANADSPINLDRDATEYVGRQLLMKMESEFTAAFFTTGVWTGAASGNDQTGVVSAPGADQFLQWNDPASTPIEDIARLSDQMMEKTGFRPNKLTVGAGVFTELKNHPDVLDRIKYTQRGIAAEDLLAQLFDVDEFLVARSTRNTAGEGLTDSYSFYFGSAGLLSYSPASAGLMQPSAGYTFSWTGYTGTGGVQGLGVGSRINRYRVDLTRSDRIEGEMSTDMHVVAADLGIYLASAVA